MEHNKFNFILVLGKMHVCTLLCPSGLDSVDPSDLVCTVLLYTTTTTTCVVSN